MRTGERVCAVYAHVLARSCCPASAPKLHVVHAMAYKYMLRLRHVVHWPWVLGITRMGCSSAPICLLLPGAHVLPARRRARCASRSACQPCGRRQIRRAAPAQLWTAASTTTCLQWWGPACAQANQWGASWRTGMCTQLG